MHIWLRLNRDRNKVKNNTMIGIRRLLFGTALTVAATASNVTFAYANGVNAERAPERSRTTSVTPGDFYLRGGAFLEWPTGARFEDKNCSSSTPAALYGCGEGVDGATLGATGDFSRTAGFELGAGYVAAQRVRIEAGIQYRPKFSFDGRANFVQTTGRQDVSADLSSLSAQLIAYADLPGRGPLSPFIGCGGGLSRNSIDETRMAFARTTTVVPGASRVGFAFLLTAGVAVRIRGKTTVDIGWRYTDSGAVETGRARGRIVWRDGSRDPLELDLAETTANLTSHGLRVSLRYGL